MSKTFAILATGESMSQEVADTVRRAKVGAIAVSDAYRLAPWADALVSQDRAWWDVHPEAMAFFGRKFSGPRGPKDAIVEKVQATGLIATGTNSALLAAHVAVTYFGAERVLLCGVDMGGTHFFGDHPAPLKNTTPARFDVMREQFAAWKPRGVVVLNCNPASMLRCYPIRDLCDALG